MKPLPPGQQRSFLPWVLVCAVLVAILAIVQFVLPHHPARDIACELGARRC